MSHGQRFLAVVVTAVVVQTIEEVTGIRALGLLLLGLSVAIAVTGYRWAKQPATRCGRSLSAFCVVVSPLLLWRYRRVGV